MKISVSDAQAIIAALQKGVDDAMAHGRHEFDLTATVEAIDDKARQELQQAIEAARSSGG